MTDYTPHPTLAEQVTEISVEDLHPSPFNPRKTFTGLSELTADIKALGRVLVPLLVRPRLTNPLRDDVIDGYEIVCGHRRARAAEAAGLLTVPCIVRAMTAAEARRAQISENLQREDVHPIEEAEGFQVLMELDGYSADDLAEQVGKSRSYVYGRLKLLQACAKVREACLDGTVTSEVALLVARLPSVKVQEQALARIASRGYNLEDGGDRSYRSIKSLLAEHYTLRLKEAIFDTADPLLLPDAGACTTCPKRTGNAPAFEDLTQGTQTRYGRHEPGDPNRCTDPACFETKKKAHLQHEASKLEAKGATVLDGAKARQAIGADGKVKGDYVALKDVQAALKKAKLKPQVLTIQDPRTGKTVQAVKRDELVQAKVVKAEPKAANHRQTYEEQQRRWHAERAEVLARCDLEQRRRMALLGAVRSAMMASERDSFDLRLAARVALAGVDWNDRATLAKLWSFDSYADMHDAVPSLTLADCTQLLLDCALVLQLTVCNSSRLETPPRVLLQAAEHYGIDAAAVMAAAVPAQADAAASAGDTDDEGADAVSQDDEVHA